MKKLSSYLCIVLLSAIFFTACKKGDIGPQGPQGPAGPQGSAGPQGQAGNSNVKLFTFGPQTFTGVLNLKLPGTLTQKFIDSCLLLVYYNPSIEISTSWYPCPGLGSGGTYDTRCFIFQSSVSPSEWTVSIRTVKPDGSGSYPNAITFTRTRVILAPASIIQAGRGVPVDLKDYNAVKNYFKLPD